MNRNLKTKVATKLLITISFIVTAIFAYQNYMINLSPSEPLGIYSITKTKEIKRGDLVAICLSKDWQTYGLQRNYILPGVRCQGSAPLIKTVVAVPGDTVILNDNNILVDQKVYSYKTLNVDSKNRPLKIFPGGHYNNTDDYWLIGTHNIKSWDSRYWGPINYSQILFKINKTLFCF